MKRRGLTLLELLVVLAILVSLATIIVPVIGHLGRKSQELATRENLLRLQDLVTNQYRADMGELPRPNLTVSPGRKNHPQLRYLFVNPDTEDITNLAGTTLSSARQWKGPYVRHGGAKYQIDNNTSPDPAKGEVNRKYTDAYGLSDEWSTATPPVLTSPGDPTILDAWGRPIVLQEPSTGTLYTPDATDKTYARLVSAGPNGIIDTPLTTRMPTQTERSDDIVIFLFRHDEYGEGNVNLE
jgi:prepilin-type N-terminal cleavage/methylation domain-containing protein